MRFLSAFRKPRTTAASVNDRFVEAMQETHGIAWFGTDGKVIEANLLFCRFLGYAPEEMTGIDYRDLTDPERGRSDADSAFFKALSGRAFDAEIVPCRTRFGERVWLQSSYVAVRGEDGKIAKIAQISSDVTRGHRLISTILDEYDAISKHHARVVFDLGGNVLDANDHFLALVGYSRDEVIGLTHAAFVHPEYSGTPKYKAFWRSIAEGTPQTGSFKRFDKNGGDVWLQSTYCPVFGASGDQTGVLQIATNITDRERANNLSSIISRVQGMVEYDLDGRIRTASTLFLDAVGYSLEEVIGKHHSMFLPDGDEQPGLWQEVRNGEFQSGEFRCRHKDGTDVWLSGAYNPIFGPQGHPVKVVQYASDITPRVHAVSALRHGLEHLASGDLSKTINGTFSDDFEPLRQDFNTAVMRLRDSLQTAVRVSSQINSGTTDISNASNDLNRRTESQAAALEQTAAAITEMSASVKSTAGIAKNTHGLMEQAKSRASAGSGVMNEARAAMYAIAESSSEISKITSVIEDIAFQTNLLALNAGVEAARAGQAGRGFAIVTSEVRALSKRSSEAATRIAQLLATSAKQVDQGVDLVSRTSEALVEIEGFVSEVAGMVGNIATAAEEQSSGISEITISISSLDQVTQENAAIFEKTNAATQVLAREVAALGQITASFILQDGLPVENARQTALRRAS
jgi:methyl-accepting chemotaxis protein